MKTVETSRQPVVTAAYLLLAFLSAFELFLIQPLIAKRILPWFGGAASVWTACLLFFQVLLFGGYCYAYVISLLRLKTQVLTHVLLLIVSVCVVGWQRVAWGSPVTPPAAWAHGGLLDHPPTIAVMVLLTLSVGMPYFLLSSTSPLLQAWFYGKREDHNPLYFFYAVSNVGSLLALLCYPALFEPFLRLPHQAMIWGIGYVGFTIVCTICGLHALRTGKQGSPISEKPVPLHTQIAETPWRDGLGWLGLSATASLMLVAMTNQICANVAPIPLLWVLPLSLYLLAFIICFSSHSTGIPTIAALLMLPATGLVLFCIEHELELGILPQLAAYCLALGCACLVCLGVLHRRRPPPVHLTFFYVMVALGGALGGLFVAGLAPVIFNDYWEFRIGLLISCAIAAWVLHDRPWMSTWRVPFLLATLAVMFGLSRMPGGAGTTETVVRSRNFYGVLKVIEESLPKGVRVHSLTHGRICHGIQFDRGTRSRSASTYFGPGSGIDLAISSHPKRLESKAPQQPLSVGVLGLGIGTIANYGEPGDTFKFYEIDPDVVSIATNREYFTYLSSCPADLDIVLGDARLSLEREIDQTRGNDFDILVLDVFNGDAIPMHLLTAEAFGTYISHLNRETGILALHITNMHLDLVPVVAGIASHHGLRGYIVEGKGDLRLTSDSLWVLLVDDSDSDWYPAEGTVLQALQPADARNVLWTDDFSNVLSIMKTKLLVKQLPPQSPTVKASAQTAK
jgi:hypothetical protein